jgi:predicted MFS family arabinose efflux permease
MPQLRAGNRALPAVIALATLNAVMAISQTNITSIYLQVSLDFHSSLYGLGILASAYFAGYGLFELPGGMVAAKIGPKKLIILGGLLTTASLLGCALSPNFLFLALFRVSAGIGYGLVFAPCLVLMMRNLGSRSVGLGAAFGTVSFSLGASIGIYAWAILSSWAGWRASLIVEFAITLASVLGLIIIVPKDNQVSDLKVKWSQLNAEMATKPMLALILAAFGGGATAILTGSFLVYYLEQIFNMAPAEAGLIGAVNFFAPLVTGIVAGKLYDKGFNAKVLIGAAAISLMLGTAAIACHSVYAAIVGSIVAGLAVGLGGTADYSVARDLSSKPEYESLNVGIVDAASLVGLFVAPLYFSAVAVSSGYSMAWLVGSLPALIFFVPMLVVKIERRNRNQTAKRT